MADAIDSLPSFAEWQDMVVQLRKTAQKFRDQKCVEAVILKNRSGKLANPHQAQTVHYRIYQEKAGRAQCVLHLEATAQEKEPKMEICSRMHLDESEGSLIAEASYDGDTKFIALARYELDWDTLKRKKGSKVTPTAKSTAICVNFSRTASETGSHGYNTIDFKLQLRPRNEKGHYAVFSREFRSYGGFSDIQFHGYFTEKARDLIRDHDNAKALFQSTSSHLASTLSQYEQQVERLMHAEAKFADGMEKLGKDNAECDRNDKKRPFAQIM